MTSSLQRSRPLPSSTGIKLLTLAAMSLTLQSNAIYCDGPPSAGCTNGLWNEAECHCDCIPPFCRDIYGACSLGVCGASAVAAWADCEAGANCPWWVNPLKTERCTTGPEVPPGIWDIYNTRADCCDMKYPYSKVCNDSSKSSDFSDSTVASTRKPTNPPTSSPTPYPTISSPEDPTTEVVPLGFRIVSLPLEVDMNAFREKMRNIVKKVVLTLAEKYSTLKILNVELKSSGRTLLANVTDNGAGGNGLLRGSKASDNNANNESVANSKIQKISENEAVDGSMTRTLQREPFEMIYDVTVLRQDGIQWAPLIREAVEDDRDYIMDQIREFAGIRDYGGGIKSDLNFCMQSFTAQGFVDCDPSLYVPITQFRPPSTEFAPTQPPSKPIVSSPISVYRPTVGTEIVIGTKNNPTLPPSDRPTRAPITLPPIVPASESKNKGGPAVFSLDTEVQVEGFTMDWWVIVLIALGVMVLLVCVFLILFSICCGRKRLKEEQVINNTIHMDKLKTRSSAGSWSSGSDPDESDGSSPRQHKRTQQRNNMPSQQYTHYPTHYPFPPDRLLPAAQPPTQQRLLAIEQQPFPALSPPPPQHRPVSNDMYQQQRIHFNQTRRPQNDPPAPAIVLPQRYARDTQRCFDPDEESLPDLSIGEIDSQFYGDFDNLAKPDPSMYSLFADYKNETKGKKVSVKNKRKLREPTAITAKELLKKQQNQQPNEPILCLENGSTEDAPGLRASQIILAGPINDETHDDGGQMPRGNMGLIGNVSNLGNLDEECTYYTEKVDGEFDGDSNNELYFVNQSRGRDKSYHIDDLPPRDDLSFPDANEVMSMISDDFPPDGFCYSERCEEQPNPAKKKKSKSRKKSKKSDKRQNRRVAEVDSELS